ITAVSTDPEGFPLTWSYAVTTGSLTNGGGATATVSQADNVFTITPTTTETYAGSFSITFSATDGTNAVTAISAFTLTFGYLQQAILHASDAQTNDWFGYDVGIDGDTLIVGARAEDTGATNAGALYVFTRSGTTWSQQAKLTASDPDTSHYFGSVAAISGDTIIVGVQSHDGDSSTQSSGGAAYIFTRSGTTWSQQAKIHNTGNATNDKFGNSVDIEGDTVVVGKWQGSSNKGAAYIFTRSGTTWSQSKYLTASDGASNDYFGKTVRISGGTVAIHAQMANNTDTSAGAVYVFTGSGSTWTQQQKLVASDADDWDMFGAGLGIDGDTIIAGAYGEATGGTNAGAAYVFTRSGTTWSQQQKIVSSDLQAGDKFGLQVDISGDEAIVAAQEEDTGGSNAGAAYIFTRSGTTWSQQQKLVAPSAAADDYFGISVAIDSDTVVVGAYKKDIGVTSEFPSGVANAGAAYVFVS
ncbi:FG-GAP repeat protein, partial [bacterium]|nr:FG-GAP repeat protein [bacterium]